jgi:phosphoadenylyl-sulfate reductase (thioredoxin)
MTETVALPDATQLVDAGRALETATPLETLRWAADRFESRLTFATGFGAEGCVLIDLIGRHRLPIDIFTLDTGLLFPETYDLWRRLEEQYALTIRSVGPELTVDEQASEHGPDLWTREPDRCCLMRKVKPLEAELGGFDAWITAIRRDQTAARADALAVEWDTRFNLGKVNPLIRWTKKDVWSHLLRHDVPYNPLHDRGFPSIGCLPCTSSVATGEDDRAGRWRGGAKTECGLHAPLVAAPTPAATETDS